MKYTTLVFLVIGLLNIHCSNSKLSEIEEGFEGAWVSKLPTKVNGKEQIESYTYIELNENNTGIKGFLIDVDGNKKLTLPSEITHWTIHSDTLIIEYVMTGGIISMPGQKDTIINSFNFKDRWLIKNKTEDEFDGVDYSPEIPFHHTIHFNRTKVFKEEPLLKFFK